MVAFLTVIHVLISIGLILSILLQSSKGGGLAGMFGGGGNAGVFGGRGAASFLSKVTMWLGISFALTSISIALLSTGTKGKAKSMVQQVMEQEQADAPVSPADILPSAPAEDQSATN